MQLRKTQLAVAVGAALLAAGTVAQAQNVTPGQGQVQVQLYGHVNRALMFADNDVQSKTFFVDGQPSSTRFGIQGTANINPGLRAGARIETEIRSNQSNAVSFDAPATGTQSFTERWMEVFVGGDWGQVHLGQGSAASDGTMEVDLSGIDLALSNPMNDFGGAIPFSSAGANTAVTPGTIMDNLDAFSRYDRLMYVSPTFNGFRVQGSVGQSTAAAEAVEASVWYAGKLAGDFQAAIGFAERNDAGPDKTTHIGGSASWLHSSGFNVSGAYGQRDMSTGDRKAKHWNLQVGYKMGQHAFGVKFEKTDDFGAVGDEGKAIGVGYVWSPVRWAEFYAALINFSGERTGLDLEDILVGAVGTRVRF